ncbi:MAG TPA: hypothetical protein VEW03_00390 [Longimicrobiaceae bacterium]|nr:hypothetical protein [Longimicrobiaceae bacterium]
MTAARYAIACAEAFVRRNGYTSIPPAADTTLLSTEPGDSVGSVAELLARRRDTLEADAFGVCVGENGEGYVVAFRYRSGAQATARAVVMSAVFGDLRVYPRDFILALVPERREGCRPVGDVAAGAGR